MTNRIGLTARFAVSSAAFAIALCFSACSLLHPLLPPSEAEVRMAIGPSLVSPWRQHDATEEQMRYAVGLFRQCELQNRPPEGFRARIRHDHNTQLQRKGVKHIAVQVPASGKSPTGWLLVDFRTGEPGRKLYETRSRFHQSLMLSIPGSVILIGGHKAQVFSSAGKKLPRDR